MAGAVAERQEHGLITTVREACARAGQPITVIAGNTILYHVTTAEKYLGRAFSGHEPLTDVVIRTAAHLQYSVYPVQGRPYALSMKGESAPSLAGGGLTGIEAMVPGLANTFLNNIHSFCEWMFQPGCVLPNFYARVSDAHKTLIVRGTSAVGGPIDFVYIGPMDVQGVYEPRTAVLVLNGTLIRAEAFATERELYFRYRPRRHDMRWAPDERDDNGVPRIWGRSEYRQKEVGGRLLVTDDVPEGAVFIPLEESISL